jgi:hypothetical protein
MSRIPFGVVSALAVSVLSFALVGLPAVRPAHAQTTADAVASVQRNLSEAKQRLQSATDARSGLLSMDSINANRRATQQSYFAAETPLKQQLATAQERLRKAQEADNPAEKQLAAAELKTAEEALQKLRDDAAEQDREYQVSRDNRARLDQEVEAAQAEVDRLQAELTRVTAGSGSPPPTGTDVADGDSDDPKKFLEKLARTIKEADEELKAAEEEAKRAEETRKAEEEAARTAAEEQARKDAAKKAGEVGTADAGKTGVTEFLAGLDEASGGAAVLKKEEQIKTIRGFLDALGREDAAASKALEEKFPPVPGDQPVERRIAQKRAVDLFLSLIDADLSPADKPSSEPAPPASGPRPVAVAPVAPIPGTTLPGLPSLGVYGAPAVGNSGAGGGSLLPVPERRGWARTATPNTGASAPAGIQAPAPVAIQGAAPIGIQGPAPVVTQPRTAVTAPHASKGELRDAPGNFAPTVRKAPATGTNPPRYSVASVKPSFTPRVARPVVSVRPAFTHVARPAVNNAARRAVTTFKRRP